MVLLISLLTMVLYSLSVSTLLLSVSPMCVPVFVHVHVWTWLFRKNPIPTDQKDFDVFVANLMKYGLSMVDNSRKIGTPRYIYTTNFCMRRQQLTSVGTTCAGCTRTS